MTPGKRRIIQALSYETIAVAVVGPSLALTFGSSHTTSFALAFTMSIIAMTWNYLYNSLFESLEQRYALGARTLRRRVMHSLGFEGGLSLMLVPLMAYVLNTSILHALFADISLLIFFLVYAFVFTWVFDKILPPPM